MNTQGGIGLFCHSSQRQILPVILAAAVGVEAGRHVAVRAVCIVKPQQKAEAAACAGGERHGIPLGPAAYGIHIPGRTGDRNILVYALSQRAAAHHTQGIGVHLGRSAAVGRRRPNFAGGAIGAEIPAEHRLAAPCAGAEIAVFQKIVAAGSGAHLQLYAVKICRTHRSVGQMHRKALCCGVGGVGIGDLQTGPVGVGGNGAAGSHGGAIGALEQELCALAGAGHAGGLHIGGEGVGLPGLHDAHGVVGGTDAVGRASPCAGDLQRLGLQIGRAACVAPRPRGGIAAVACPKSRPLKAAVAHQIHHGVLQLGGQSHLAGAFAIGLAAVLVKPCVALAVLHGNGAAEVVELVDLFVPVVILKNGLVVGVLNVQRAACDALRAAI